MLNKCTTNYVVAGGNTFLHTTNRRIDTIMDSYDIDKNDLKNLFYSIMNKSLLSFGINLGNKGKINNIKDTDKYINNIVTNLERIHSIDFLPDNFKMYIDSGGFQISMGYIPVNEIPKFTNMYKTFLINNSNLYNYAFSLDIPPNDITYNTFEDVYNLNKISYESLIDLPEDIRKKIIYVYHFRTPETLKVWNKLTFEDKLIDKIGTQNWAIGGIVASLSGETDIPIISYSLPLIPILKWAINNKITEFNFHILGGSAYRDILYYSIIKKHIYEKYNITINFTYDSSGLFKQLMMGRFLDVMDEDGFIFKLNLMSNKLNYKPIEHSNHTNISMLEGVFDELTTTYNLTKVDLNTCIYDINSGAFHPYIEFLLSSYLLYFYVKLQYSCENLINDIYPLYYTNSKEFERIIFEKLHKLNRGTLSKKFKNKTYSILRSIDFLNDLDTNKTEQLINKYMYKDEFTTLLNSEYYKKIYTF